MAQRHFKQLGMDSYYGNLVCTRGVPRDHLLVTHNQLS